MTNTPRYASYIICTSPRSGSTLLCRLLDATRHAGHPDSHFHTPSLSAWMQTYDIDQNAKTTKRDNLKAVFAAARTLGTGSSQIFGLRLQRASFDFFRQQLALLYPQSHTDKARIEAAFGRTAFIHLTRPNKLDQAISRLKAEQTGLWHRAADGAELERLSPPKAPQYDAAAISHHLAELTEQDAQWAAWFKREDIQPVQISYDDLSDDPLGVLSKTLDMLGLDPSLADTVTPPTAKLSDAVSLAWADRFRG
ncbi:MAG: Stf0 family sulfotransferase [Aliishimia sp.]